MTKHLIAGEFFINVVRAALLICVAKYTFEVTGQIWSFGLTFIVSAFSSFIIPFYIGDRIDRFGAERVLKTCMLLVVSLFAVSLICSWFLSVNLYLVLSASIAFNLLNPILKMTVFVLIPQLSQNRNLTKENGKVQIAFHCGQLSGLAVAAAIMELAGLFEVYLALTLFSLLSLFFYARIVTVGNTQTVGAKKEQDTISNHAFYKSIISAHGFLFLISLSTFDYTAVALFNLSLPPIVDIFHNGLARYLSIYDAAYAVGAVIISVYLKQYVTRDVLSEWLILLSPLSTLMMFGLFNFEMPSVLRVITIVCFGCCVTLSTIFFNSYIQKNYAVHVAGKVIAFKGVATSIVTSIAILAGASAFDMSFSHLIFFAALMSGLAILLAMIFIVKISPSKQSLSINV